MQIDALINALVFARAKFDGDLDNLLIMAVILDSYVAQGGSLRPDVILSSQLVFNEQRATNALSIAQFTGIPRETVRRKVERLTEKGHVTRNDKGYLMLTEQGWADIRNAAQVLRDLQAARG